MLRVAPIVLVALTLSGCLLRSATYFFRDPVAPMRSREVRVRPPARQACLVVMLPGLFDIPDQFFEHGLVDDAMGASDRCDLLVVDSHVGYYQRGVIQERLEADVLRMADARGYDEIWLVGVSMGGLGALLLARARPGRIRGIVLLSPWLGDESVVRAVHEAGGLSRWTPPAIDHRNPQLRDATIGVLTWLRDREGGGPELYLGVGADDRWRAHADVLDPSMMAGPAIVVPGNHDWTTWRALFRRVLESPPWASGAVR